MFKNQIPAIFIFTMERYVLREKRFEEPQGNQMISFSATSTGNIPSSSVYGNPDSNAIGNVHRTQYRSTYQQPQLQQNQGRVMSGIDPRYLSSYSDHSAPLIVYGQQMPREDPDAFGNYQSRMFVGPARNETKLSSQGIPYGLKPAQLPAHEYATATMKNTTESQPKHPKTSYGLKPAPVPAHEYPIATMKNTTESQPKHPKTSFATKKQEVDFLKNEEQCQVKTRSEKLKELHKIGTKVFSGPVEKILKWNKAVQEIGAMVLYEIVGKCVSIRPEHPYTKNLVIRDENGPAMQVVYHEIDFLLPDFTVPCMIRVIGRMMPGTCRLQAYSVRAASGDDMATLPRRAAVAAHHVAKLCKEYGHN